MSTPSSPGPAAPPPPVRGDLQALIDRANGEQDPVLCNLRITLAHRLLAGRLREVTGVDAGANFHSWAVWGSKKAGVTVRQEDLDAALSNATRVSGIAGALVGAPVAAVVTTVFRLAPLGSIAGVGLLVAGALLGAFAGALVGRAVARWSRRRASELVLAGNRLVLDDIGRQTARFVETFRPGERIDDARLEAFLDGLKPGAPELGGQDLLRDAFRLYARAANATEPRDRHEACYFANCLAILNEHVKLQPYIVGAMPFIIQRCVTKRMLTFGVGPRELAVAVDVPPLDGHVAPPTLATLSDPRLLEFLDGPGGWRRRPDSPVDSRARNWTRLRDRMGYIVHLFRCFHLDASVLAPPYDDAQVLAIERGTVPAGRL